MDTQNYNKELLEKLSSDSVEALRAALQGTTVTVAFTKKDGSERVMLCTTNFDIIPVEHHPKPKPVVVVDEFEEAKPETPEKPVNPDLFRVFEIGSGWKSFTTPQLVYWYVV